MYPKGIVEVFNAYAEAIKTKLGKNPDIKPYTTISFGLNFSFKFNMNGGSCTVRFMPYNNDTAVNVRYSIAQGTGARYGAHCSVFTKEVERLLGCSSLKVDIDAEEFIKYANSVASDDTAAATTPQPQAPIYEAVPAAPIAAAPQQDFKFCPSCGTKLNAADRFCVNCGKPQQ